MHDGNPFTKKKVIKPRCGETLRIVACKSQQVLLLIVRVNLMQDEGGMMTLTDVYCRFNRARGMEVC